MRRRTGMKRIAFVIALGFIMLCWTLAFQNTPGLQQTVIVVESVLMGFLLATPALNDDEGKDSNK